MTVQEAKIKQVEITKQILDDMLSCSKGIEILSESLEKQIPQKPTLKAMDGTVRGWCTLKEAETLKECRAYAQQFLKKS